jgi:AraC-like DNA-binding protein
LNVVEDVGSYEQSVYGIQIRSMRTGLGIGPNRVLAAAAPKFAATSVDVGFPMASRSSMAEDRITVVFLRSVPGGARWCGIDLQPGMVVMYGPGAEHQGVNPVGLSWDFAVIELDVLEELCDGFGSSFRPPRLGSVSALEPSPHVAAAGAALSSFFRTAAAGTTVQAIRQDDVLDGVAAILCGDSPSWSVAGGRKVDRRRVVCTSIDYAESIGRAPTITELCRATHVSERLLRDAFVEECGMPPAAFLRMWVLNESHRSLRVADPSRASVTEVVMGLGISHVGRFSGQYAQLFGEFPSATLSSHA